MRHVLVRCGLLSPVLGLCTGIVGCKDLTGNPGLPAGTPSPSYYNSAAGAIGMRNAAIFEVEQALPQYALDAGLMTDELEDPNTGASQGQIIQQGVGVSDPPDERIFPPAFSVQSYGMLQAVRTFANQAIGALATYDTTAADLDSSKVRRGELYAMEGYAEIMLADLFCSGVPLSTLDFHKDFTYAASSTTTQVYQDAIVKFDSAIALAGSSDSVVSLARIGQGRANLELGKYSEAADDVTTVPDGFLYQLVVSWGVNGHGLCVGAVCDGTESDHEGINGLPYRSSGDPRTIPVGFAISDVTGDSLYFPAKYNAALNSGSSYAPFTLASGIEARLIEAEAALHANPNDGVWLAKLNALRATVSLGQLSDPVDPVARLDTLFTERAYWLYLTGHRQGDLRRLLREYSQYTAFQSQQQVYPTGPYLAPGTGAYGSDVVAPIPAAEAANPSFHGCLTNEP